jgi:uncharacterized protein with beta-barrel porin domain
VTVDNEGQVQTSGANAQAIFAQSVGGGGGNGGGASSGGALFGVNTSSGVWDLGGAGGAAGNGGFVAVTNHSGATIAAAGDQSVAIFAQSIGGGGGNGSAFGNVLIHSGGSSGANGNGGAVNVVNNGSIILTGNNSLAIMAQSLGGGGGTVGGVGSVGSGGVVTLGGVGATGNGDAVNVVNTGDIFLNGNNSVGIFAQSLGGGGGLVLPGTGTTNSIITLSSANSGNGGSVTITNTGNIYMNGDNDVAVFNQSVGGGGGAVGVVTDPPGQIGAFIYSGSAGGSGLAQATIVNQTGNLIATGLNSIALVAQSAATDGQGDITVNITNPSLTVASLIEGGSAQGDGISILGGANNTLNNAGIVTSVLGIDGYAVRGTDGNDAINNSGLIVGSVDLGAGVNGFNNLYGAAFNSGAVVALGAGSLLDNEGLLSPGGYARVLTSNVTGNFVQGANATYAADLELTNQTADQLAVSGTAVVHGNVLLNILNPGMAQTGSHNVALVQASGGVTDHLDLSLTSVPSAVATYSLIYPNTTDVTLNYVINYSPTGLTGNQHAVGNAVNAIMTDRTSPAFTPMAAALFYEPTVQALGGAYNSLSGEAVTGSEQTAFAASGRLTSNINNQVGSWLAGDYLNVNNTLGDARRPLDMMLADAGNRGVISDVSEPMFRIPGLNESSRSWRLWVAAAKGFGSMPGNATIGSSSLSYQGSGRLIGLDHQISQNSMVGIALGDGKSSYSVANGDGSYGYTHESLFALYGAWRDEHLYVTGALDFGSYKNDTYRTASIPGFNENLTGNYGSRSYGSEVEIGWRTTANNYFGVSPFVALRYATLSMDSFTETQTNGQASQIGLSYGASHVVSNPVSIGTKIDMKPITLNGGAKISGWLRLAFVHENNLERAANASFIAAPGYSFTVNGAQVPRDSGRIDSGILLKLTPAVGVFGNFNGSFLSTTRAYESTIGLNVQW